MRDIAKYLPSKTRQPRKANTRWLLHAIERGIINPSPATGKVLNRHGKEYSEYTNYFGYKYIKVFMYQSWFSFYVHKCIYLKVHGKIPRSKELDHVDQNILNNKAENIQAVTYKQNLSNRRLHKVSEAAF